MLLLPLNLLLYLVPACGQLLMVESSNSGC